ncbi:MAG TPA: protein phosphatase 2C domain-containing protein [Blastocatellia bacterium]|nr:protein phosphatase 2C domain-containing protein [Blastocatellia bacterium]HMX30233.1 protein phosphatase 2C domain-containing protein [Blastocatellia bacterium]HMY75249.1 protein phosphatase 2C domain-containing protein [Blastocatellia bacterium]HMZ18504.1 protein phosphatase 2C domain-containing protein [Blastocatellia bacterium]HNG30545.1 protein phosphatase 2C domain-containing protein [Blastocatellia bacterium]
MADPTINLALYAQTDVGMVRSGNEDNFLILDLSTGKSWTANEEEPQELLTYTQGYYGTLLAVSDGMGGALAGEVASRIAVETVRDRMLQLQAHEVYGKMPFSERLRLAVEEANAIIHTDGQTNQAHRGLGATFTAVATQGNHVYFAQVGDSRAHLIRQGKIYRVTKDQSLVQQLIDAGQITEEEAETHSYRNVILQALGAHNNVNVEVNAVPLCQLDTLVICSDGLSGKMHADEIARIVNEAADFKSACQALINLANERGGEDNITVVVAQFSGAGLPLPDGNSLTPKSLARSPDTPTEISWVTGARTDPLGQSPGDAQPSSGAQPPDGEVRKTEPLPLPPKQATPFTASLHRSPSGKLRTNDFSDRVEPITAVFSAEDLETDVRMTSPRKPTSATDSFDSRHSKPTSAVQSPTDTPSDKHRPSSNNSNGGSPVKKFSGTNLFIFIGLALLGIAGLVLSATTYFKQQSEQKTVQQETQKTNSNQKESRIKDLSETIERIDKTIQAVENPSKKEKSESLKERLKTQKELLIQAANIPDDQPQIIKERCDEISKKLKEIEDELKTIQGFLPVQKTSREPVKL